jgi:hypothetical protein
MLWFQRVERMWLECQEALITINERLRKMAKQIDDLILAVEAEKTVTQSAIVLIQELDKRLDEVISSGDLAKLDALSADLKANSAALAAAVVAGTPADPAPVPAPTPTP